MRGKDLLDKMELVDPTFVEAAEAVPAKKKRSWVKWGAMAAGICLVVIGALGTRKLYVRESMDDSNENITYFTEEQGAYGFKINEDSSITYYPISFDERLRYGLVEEGAVGLTSDNAYNITEDDLGDFIGTVGVCIDEKLIGCNVFHFAKYPDYDSICIVETQNGYAFYTADGISTDDSIGQSSNNKLAAYGLPETFEKMEILTADQQYLCSIEDEATITAIFEVVSGKENSGLEANERRFAQAWYDAYGNEDVYFDEESGTCSFNEKQPSQEEYITSSDEEGNSSVEMQETELSTYETAQALWTNGERLIQITTNQGFTFYMDYFPSIKTIIWENGYYEITETDVNLLNTLLQITIE